MAQMSRFQWEFIQHTENKEDLNLHDKWQQTDANIDMIETVKLF